MGRTGDIPTRAVNGRWDESGGLNPLPGAAPPSSSSTKINVESALSWLILISGISTLAFAVYLTVASYTSVPFLDEWVVLDSLVTAPHPLPLGWLVLQENEHRFFFYRLLLLADLRLCKGNYMLIFASMYALQLFFLALIAWMLRTIGGIRGVLWRVGVGGAAYCLFCPSQWENFSWAIQVSVFLPGFFLLLGLVSLVLYAIRDQAVRRWQYILFAIVATASATYSNANGILTWPVLICVGLVLKIPPRVIGVLAAAGIGFVGLYFIHYTTPIQHASPLQSLWHPLILIEYVAKYFGGSFLGRLALPIGVAGLLAAAALAIRAALRGYITRPIVVVLFGTILFCLATASVTALGRINFGTDQAFSSRYQTIALLFWLSLGCLTVLAATGRAFRIVLLAAVVVVILLSAVRYKTPLRGAMKKQARTSLGSFALMAGILDQRVVDLLFPVSPDFWRQFSPAVQSEMKATIARMLVRDSRYLCDQQLSFFSGDVYGQLNQPLTVAYHVEPQQACMGGVDAVERVPMPESDSIGLRIRGWAVGAHSRWPVRSIVASAHGTVVGFGEPGFERLYAGTEVPPEVDASSGWIAYARVPANATTLDVYGILDRPRELCRIASAPVNAQ